jgi:hypothetical protein
MLLDGASMNRTTAFGAWRFADEYCRAAAAVNSIATGCEDLVSPRYYLLGHSIELALKAFLLSKGVPLSELRSKKLGHDLEKALVRAEELGLQNAVTVSDQERADIILLNKTYQSKEHEYISTGSFQVPKMERLLAILHKVLPAIRATCLEAIIDL